MTASAEQKAERGPLPPVSVLPAPGDEEWDPDLAAMGCPITERDEDEDGEGNAAR